MGVELRVPLAAGLVAELGDHQVLRVLDVGLPSHLLASLGALLGGGDGTRHRPVVRLDEAGIPAHERLKGHALRRREGEVDADAALCILPRRGAARVPGRGHVAGEELTEALAVHRPGESKRLGSPALPGRRLALPGVVVIGAVLVVARRAAHVLAREDLVAQHGALARPPRLATATSPARAVRPPSGRRLSLKPTATVVMADHTSQPRTTCIGLQLYASTKSASTPLASDRARQGHVYGQ
jgi:hypothetical protein